MVLGNTTPSPPRTLVTHAARMTDWQLTETSAYSRDFAPGSRTAAGTKSPGTTSFRYTGSLDKPDHLQFERLRPSGDARHRLYYLGGFVSRHKTFKLTATYLLLAYRLTTLFRRCFANHASDAPAF